MAESTGCTILKIWWKCMAFWTLLYGVALCAPSLDITKSGQEWSSTEKLEKALQSAAAFPLHSQKVFLKTIGEASVDNGQAECNLFGGVDACVQIPAVSNSGTACNLSNKTVDCAFKLQAFQGTHSNPSEFLKEKLSFEGYPSCQGCYRAIEKLWCAQTLPSCGTFDKVVDELLPAINMIISKKLVADVALQEATPRIFQALSLGLPCKKMCNALVKVCGCGHLPTFGEVMTKLQKHPVAEYSTNISVSTAKVLFAKIWGIPICDFFVEETMPGFSGVCEVTNDDTSCEWCKGKLRPETAVYEKFVSQLSQMFSGMMQGGLQKILIASSAGKSKRIAENWDWTEHLTSGNEHQSGHKGIFIFLFFMVVIAAGAFVAAVRAHRNREFPSQYVDLNSMGYTPPIL
ncbi:hypothetical protein O6H91_02G137000 [Diphasiastrum complanatum]|uniref:Uncharacterized protein n=1 Tax=Diphasiastrum complanatum TaxID=34168 RepID=A0ACC2EL59_DIPCM|nr:hypothetical protein O6H91_02G137000 [Diphasiastrum complanatum]